MMYRSQARLAHAYVLPISSSALRLLILLRDWASRELANSMSSGGREPGWRGMRLFNACSIGLLILTLFYFVRSLESRKTRLSNLKSNSRLFA